MSGQFERAGFILQHIAFLSRLARILDGLIIFTTLYIATLLSRDEWSSDHTVIGILAVLVFEIVGSMLELYRSWRVIRFRFEVLNILADWTLTIVGLLALLYVIQLPEMPPPSLLVLWAIGCPIALATGHYAIRLIERHSRAFGHDRRRVAFVGANERTDNMIETFNHYRWMGMDVVGVFDDRFLGERSEELDAVNPLAGNSSDLIRLARSDQIDTVFITLPMKAEDRIKSLIDEFSDTTLSVYYCPSFMSFDLLSARWDTIADQPVISVLETPFHGNAALLKRMEDIVLSIAFLIVFSLPMLMIALLIKTTSSGPVLFGQTRHGVNGKAFTMWKFRTMDADSSRSAYRQAVPDDPRVTRVGRVLRRTSMDELPQLFNVLWGDMSVVGPRPHPDVVNEDLRSRIYRYMIRHKIKPGMTGLAQVSGFRGQTEQLEKMEQRISYDLLYIKEWSLWLDIKILFRTFFVVANDQAY